MANIDRIELINTKPSLLIYPFESKLKYLKGKLPLLNLAKLDFIGFVPSGPAWVALGGARGTDVSLPQIEAVLAAERKMAAQKSRTAPATAKEIVEEAILAQTQDLNHPFNRATAAVWLRAKATHFTVLNMATSVTLESDFNRRFQSIHRLPFLEKELFWKGRLLTTAIACGEAAELLDPKRDLKPQK